MEPNVFIRLQPGFIIQEYNKTAKWVGEEQEKYKGKLPLDDGKEGLSLHISSSDNVEKIQNHRFNNL